jgi:hypothetical protein
MTSSRLAQTAKKTALYKTFRTHQRKDTRFVSVKNKTTLTCIKRSLPKSHTQNTELPTVKYEPVGVVQENNCLLSVASCRRHKGSAWEKLRIS